MLFYSASLKEKLGQWASAVGNEIESWPKKVEKGLSVVVNEIASAAEKLYNKYGSGAVNALKTGFEEIGGAFEKLGSWIETGLKVISLSLSLSLSHTKTRTSMARYPF